MEENEGKDLAQDMKNELLKKIRGIQNEKRQEHQNENIYVKYYENCELKLGKYPLKVSVAEINEKMLDQNGDSKEIITYDIYMKFNGQDVLIANINEEGKLQINEEIVEKIDPENKLGLLELGEEEKPDLSVLKELDGKTEKELEQEKEEKDKKKEETNKDDNEKQESKDEPEKEEIAKRYNVSSKNVVHLNVGSKKITEDKTFSDLVKWAEGRNDLYIITDRKGSITQIVEKSGKEYNEIEQDMQQVQGNNPTNKIHLVENDKIRTVIPLKIYQIDSKQAFATIKNQWGELETIYCRKQEGKEEYFGEKVPEEHSNKNVRQLGYKERSFMDEKNTSNFDLSKKADELNTAKDHDNRGVPSKEKGVQVYEIEQSRENNRIQEKENIKEDLYNRMGITEKTKAGLMPGQLEYLDEKFDKQAEKIQELMENDINITYEEAVKQVQSNEEIADHDNDEKAPWDNPRNRR